MIIGRITIFLTFYCTPLFVPLLAYEVGTHEEISEEAAFMSSWSGYLPMIGLKSLNDQLEDVNAKRSIVGWIRKGAHDEDDTLSLNFARYRNHFYDPLSELGLNAAATGEPSPDWGLEDTQTFATQFYSFKDARQYFYDALTLPNKDDRDQRMARTFYTLGHVIHLIQDAAQPQHTRNDSHGGGIFGPPSLYEKWTDAHRNELPYDASAKQYPNARAFWTNASGTGLAQFTNRNFVSAGTNFQMLDGRVSANSTYRNPEPTSETSVDVQQLFADEKLPPPRDQNGNLLHGDIVFIGSDVDGAPNSKASTLSIFDQDLKTYNKTVTYEADPLDPSFNIQVTVDRVFTLNQFNFRAAYPYLIPKAVGYSAGMIDYFFRGEMDFDIDYDSTTGGQYLILNEWREDMKGTFALYYDAVDGKRYPVRGDTDEIAWKDVTISKNDKSISLIPPFLPSDPKPKRPDEYILVFKGEMGEEKPLNSQSIGAVVAKSKLRLLWEPWREELTDNHPWTSGAGTVNGKIGPNSQTLENGRLVEYAGVSGAGWVAWEAESSDDLISGRYMKIRLNCSESATTENWNVYGYLSVGPSLFRSQTIPFAGGAGTQDSSPYKLVPRPMSEREFIIDLGGLGNQIGYLDMVTIGFDMELTCSVDYLDFSDEPFKKVADGAVFIP